MPHASGLRVGVLVSVFPDFYPPARLILTAWFKNPRVEATRGAPSFLNVMVYCGSGILSSMDAVKRKDQKRE